MTTSQRNGERTRVMIVEHDLDYGMKLADWLATHGYHPVLLRTVEAAIGEVNDIRPQAIFIGLRSPERGSQMNAFEALLLIQTICPLVPVITIGDRASEDFAQLVVRQGVRRFLVKPVEFSHIVHALQSELSVATV
jgi:DNA-binding NtrC family response regulator